jgi:RNA polymerase sigma-70 factor, ECF subfamily
MAPVDIRQDAFRLIYQAHYRAIAAYARRRLGTNDADDVVADTFLVAWRRLEEIPSGDLTLPWLYGVARRVTSQRRRSGRRRDRLMARLSNLGRPHEVTSPGHDHGEDNAAVHVALARLRPNDRELLRLAEWEELTPLELAGIFNCSTNAISIRLHRAHRRFGQALRSVERDREPAQRQESSR